MGYLIINLPAWFLLSGGFAVQIHALLQPKSGYEQNEKNRITQAMAPVLLVVFIVAILFMAGLHDTEMESVIVWPTSELPDTWKFKAYIAGPLIMAGCSPVMAVAACISYAARIKEIRRK